MNAPLNSDLFPLKELTARRTLTSANRILAKTVVPVTTGLEDTTAPVILLLYTSTPERNASSPSVK